MSSSLDPRDDAHELPAAPSLSPAGGEAPRALKGWAEQPAIAPGDVIAERYRVEQLLARGGMGQVFVGRDFRLDRRVAIKVLLAAGDETSARRLEQEARAAASLQHVNVVVVHDVGLHRGLPFVVTEMLEGETLRARLARGPLSLEQALDCAIEIASGLSAAHRMSIVHRDLKPENVFLVASGPVKLLDFGLAKFVPAADATMEPDASGESLTTTGQIIGTAGYMSPQQLRGEPVDARCDIFSFGAVLFEMLAGLRAFPGATSVERAYFILHRPAPALTEVPPLLGALVGRCLCADAAQRFASGEELLRALETLRPKLPRELPRRTRRSARLIAWLAVPLAAVALVLLFTRLRPKAPPPLPVSVAQMVELARTETSSPAALAAFQSGELALRDGDRSQARGLFREAAAQDIWFPLAQYRLAFSASAEEPGLAADAIRHAISFAHEGHDRERFLSSGFLALMEGRSADTFFDQALRLEPADVEAQIERGDFFFHFDPLRGGNRSRTEDAFARALALDPDEPTALEHLLDLAEMDGQREAAALLANRLLARGGEQRQALPIRWTRAWARGDAGERAKLLQELRAPSQAPSSALGEVMLTWLRARWEDADLASAEELARLLTAHPQAQDRARGLLLLALTERARGRPQAALAELDEALRIDGRASVAYDEAWMVSLTPGVDRAKRLSARATLGRLDATVDPLLAPLAVQLEGLLALQDGDLTDAESRAEQLERSPLFENSSLTTDLADGLRAQLALTRADPNAAQGFFDKMELRVPYRYVSRLARLSQQTARAQLALDAGHPELAQRWLQLAYYAPYETVFIGPVLSLRARAAELAGDRDGALRDLRHLTALYANCEEPFRPQLEDARARLAALSGDKTTSP